ncbi:hypothetical protein CU048_07585 [Beijerinckiaceae bacterium]|nr:hypothetical protein CU048_07585 [Beijerinckiaceae bacterium]
MIPSQDLLFAILCGSEGQGQGQAFLKPASSRAAHKTDVLPDEVDRPVGSMRANEMPQANAALRRIEPNR